MGAAGLGVAIVAWWILGKISMAYGRWNHRRVLAKGADPETMNKYRWSDHDLPEAFTSSDQRAAKSRKSGGIEEKSRWAVHHRGGGGARVCPGGAPRERR